MYYFASRQAAGDLITNELEAKYRYEECAVLALSSASVMVGAPIAKRFHCVINLLLTSPIRLPRENDVLAVIDNFGGITYNSIFTQSEIELLKSENFNYIEEQKLEKLMEMNRMLGRGRVLDARLFQNKNIIVVSDGLVDGYSLQAAVHFLRPVKVKRLVMAAPFATVNAVDTMHILADEMVCLNVLDNLMPVDHYYDDNSMPPEETIFKTIESIIAHWR